MEDDSTGPTSKDLGPRRPGVFDMVDGTETWLVILINGSMQREQRYRISINREIDRQLLGDRGFHRAAEMSGNFFGSAERNLSLDIKVVRGHSGGT